MAQGSGTSAVIAAVTLAASCALGLAATAYGVTVAYLMGASAQAQEDGTSPANPQVLIRNSFQQIMDKAKNGQLGAIDVDDGKVEVNTVDSTDETPLQAEVI